MSRTPLGLPGGQRPTLTAANGRATGALGATASGWLWRRLPNRVSRVSPTLGGLLADGRHVGAVRIAGWLAPLAALVTGLVAGSNHDMFTYIASLLVMTTLVTVGMQGAALGVWALVGYIVGDLQNPAQDPLIAVTIGNFDFIDRVAQYYYPQALSYVVLALLIVVNPMAARAIGSSIRFGRGAGSWAASAIVTAAAAAFLTYLWARSAQYLLRPLWTLRDGIDRVPPDMLLPLHDHPSVLALAAGLSALVGVAIEAVINLRSTNRVRSLTPAPRSTPPLVSLILAAPVKGVLAAAIMTGVLERWQPAVTFAAAITVVELIRTVVMPRIPVLPTALERVPLLVRIAVAMAVAYAVTDRYVRSAAETFRIDFTPMVVGAFVAYAIAAVLFPGPVPSRRPARPARPVTAHPVVVVFLLAAALWSASYGVAYADDCSGFSDCSLSQKGAMWATGGLFGLLAGAMLANRRGAERSAAEQKTQDDLEKLAKDLAKGGQDVGKTSPDAQKVQDAIDKAKREVEGVNPGQGRNNCARVADAVDQRFGGEGSPIAPVVGDDSQGTPAADSERWNGHGNTWQPGVGPAAAAEWVRETGGRGILHIDWAGGGGHVINVVPVDGTVLFVDGQKIPPAVSSTLYGLYPPSQVDGITGYAFLPTWPPG